MSFIRAIALTTLLALPMTVVEPAFARPNDGRYQKSGEAMKKADACDLYKGLLDLAEKRADERAGTKAAKKYADEADSWWEAGVRHGCSWAA
jgi:hypothetical protein